MKGWMVFTTVPNLAVGRKLAKEVLERRFAACIHLAPRGESHYWWKGKIEKAQEVAMIFKTSKKALPLLLHVLKDIHPYEIPEILAFRIDHGNVSYLKWLEEETNPKSKSRKGWFLTF